MTDELRRSEFVDQLTRLERRLTEQFELLERLIALGFDDTRDQIRAVRCGLGTPPGGCAPATSDRHGPESFAGR